MLLRRPTTGSSTPRPSSTSHALTDTAGTGFLLLTGPEPDMQWERFAAAVEQLVERLGVRLTVSFDGIPMAVPHTRPIGVTAHATRPELIAGLRAAGCGGCQVPGQRRAPARVPARRRPGRDAMGFAVHVPHYLAQAEYPEAARALLDRGVRGDRPVAADRRADARPPSGRGREIDEQVARLGGGRAASSRALEQQYDAFVDGQPGGSLLAGDAAGCPAPTSWRPSSSGSWPSTTTRTGATTRATDPADR